jgi:hypothetical protein
LQGVEVALLIAHLKIVMALEALEEEATVLIETPLQLREQQILAVVVAVVELQAPLA